MVILFVLVEVHVYYHNNVAVYERYNYKWIFFQSQ